MIQQNPNMARWPGRIFRLVPQSQTTPGEKVDPAEVDIVPVVYFKREKKRGSEEFGDGVFKGRDWLKLSFLCPGFGVRIVQGDRVEITYGTRDPEQYIVEACYEPSDIGNEDWIIGCYDEVLPEAC